MLFKILKLSDVDDVFKRAGALLDSDIKVLRGRTGWHQYISEQKVGEVATSQGILILSLLNRRHRLLPDLFNTIREAQLHVETNDNSGGWAMLSSHDIATTEPTSWAILSLLLANDMDNTEAVRAGVDWIRRNQNIDGGWGPKKQMRSRTYTTFMACRCLSETEPFFSGQANYFAAATQWLISCQNPDGGWGATAGESSTAIHTAFVIITLNSLAIDYSSKNIMKGVQFLLQQWDKTTFWEHTQKLEQYELPKDELAWTRITFQYFTTAWAIVALLAAGESIFRQEVFSSVEWIVKSQNGDGSWTLDGVPRNRIWAVYDAILAISTFLDKAVSAQTIDRMILLDDILVLTEGQKGKGLARLAFFTVGGLILGGALLGAILGSATELHLYIGPWIQKYWAWVILGIYTLSVVPLLRWKIISKREAVIGMLFPALLVLIQVYLKP